ncbi:MAG: cysteine synthase family protein [Chloracidobacterium sp.]|uniref:Cysteine synthase family protein n=1 Tax=Chloracidobacterium validum TaxID=2821543 RepID=A0ABX8BE46_9BACT|nr:cysteine synthase family protein [Chloracidobacterium validum]QUW04296.1 cysteine synthase family protein [Chloracidobacterium validum]
MLERPCTLAAAVGNTPLIQLRRVTAGLPEGVEVYAKAEHLNPGGSVKDRAALNMLRDGERRGALHPGKTILDATSGNTGIAYAMLGAALGYPVTLCLPRNASPERKKLLRVYGAEIIETDPLEATDGAQRLAKQLAAEQPETYFYPDQYNNDANWQAHYNGTGLEIWEQTQGRVTHFLAGLGTSGTFVGTARRLKALSPTVQCIAMQPDSPLHGLEGMKHMATALVPGIYDPTLADANVEVATEAAQAMARRLVREEGLFVGVSAGANVVATLELARTLPPGSVVVTILCDAGTRYLSDHLWDEGKRT